MEPSFISTIWLALFTFAGISLLLYTWTRINVFKYFSFAWLIEGARTTVIDFGIESDLVRFLTYLAYIPVTWFLIAAVVTATHHHISRRVTLWYFGLSGIFIAFTWYFLEPYLVQVYGQEFGAKLGRFILCLGVFLPAGVGHFIASGMLAWLSRRQHIFVPLIGAFFFTVHGLGTISIPVNQFYFNFNMPGADLFWVFQALGVSAGMILIGSLEFYRGWKETAQALETLVHAAPTGICVLDSAGCVESCNPAAQRILGDKESRLLGHPLPKLFEESEDRLWQLCEDSMKGNVTAHEVIHDYLGGGECYLSVSLAPLNCNNQHDGKLLLIFEDVTQRRQAERQLRQSQRMEAIGQLTSGVAHDFNNILTVIQGRSELLRGNLELPPGAVTSVDAIIHSVQRGSTLTRQLQMYSRTYRLSPEELELNRLIEEVCDSLPYLIGENVRVECNLADDLPPINADRALIEQVIFNLAANARDAMPGGGRLTLNTWSCRSDGRFAAIDSESKIGGFVCLSVEDTGCGIPKEYHSNVFEPFFTTKEPGKGTGLGLASAYGVVKQHEGWIELESAPNEGTAFKLFFPAGESKVASTSPDRAKNESYPRGGNGETILVVEDEEAVRELTRSLLEESNFRVLETSSTEEAKQLWETNKEEIRVLVADVILAETSSGSELAEALRRDRPALPVIYVSGYTADKSEKHTRTESATYFLSKPYSSVELFQTLNECLNKLGNNGGQANGEKEGSG